MSKVFSVNSNNDIYIDPDGNLAIATGQEALLQACASAAKAQFREMVLAFDQGVANFQTIWTDATNIAQFEFYVRKAIKSVEGVLEIVELTAVAQNNVVSYTATIRTIYGEAALNG